MERRSFLRATALAGLASAAPWVFSRVRHRAFAQEVIYKGPYWVFVEAGGGGIPDSSSIPLKTRTRTDSIKALVR